MWNVPSQERLDQIPRLYETESIPIDEKVIHLHFFLGGSDWFIVEYDGGDLFFGYAILNGDLDCAEWGYVSFAELKSLALGPLEVDCEPVEIWRFKRVKEVGLIRAWRDDATL